jgi:DNA adenine methylase
VVKPPCPWLGNKAQLLPYIQQLLPPKKEQFLDAFGGGGSVILNQPPKRGRLDIYNDLDDNLFNLMLCIREKLLALCNALKFLPVQGRTAFKFYQNFDQHEAEFYKNIEQEMELLHDRTLVSEEQAAKFLSLLLERKGLFDVYRAAAFLMVRYGSFSGTGSSFGVKTIDVEAIIERLPAISKRLQSIVLENRDAFDLIAERACPNGIVYADPPYLGAEGCYDVLFISENHMRLRNLILESPGDFLLSYNNLPPIIDLYKEDFYICALKRNNPLSQKKGATYGELFITNYDPRPYLESQIDLFDPDPQMKGELVLINIPNKIHTNNWRNSI